MNFEHLKVFYTAAKQKNFSKTAKILHLSQPSVSSQIQQLEESLNVKLFKRTTKKIDLTQAGEILFQSAEKILNLVSQTEREIAQFSGSIHGELIIGASVTIGEHILPYVLGLYKKQYPNVQIIMKIYNSEQIIKKLSNGEIQLAFIQSDISYPQFCQRPFLEDELVVITPYEWSHSILNDKNYFISQKELFSAPIILRESGSGTRRVIEEQLKRNNLDPDQLNIVLELENTESIKSAVESGMGISIISKVAVLKELRLKTLRQLSIQGIPLKRKFFTIYDDKKLTLPGETFLSFIYSYYKENLGGAKP
ncbi:selenium metabolism-associated LysR family transcriptional regulator [Scopulibacillus cellulosilyticus]|uniref:Selenium metabolism-associated LysR family transcriptional regulator n=1 Tax=Scopulibacillus cellulosilyticus TaxID=2665665 RepID=A0ABW2PSD2_9BACL